MMDDACLLKEGHRRKDARVCVCGEGGGSVMIRKEEEDEEEEGKIPYGLI